MFAQAGRLCHHPRHSDGRGETPRPRNAFTLVEVLVATIIVGLIAASVSVVIGRTFKTRSTAEAKSEAQTRSASGATIIARAIEAVARDNDLTATRLQIIPGSGTGKEKRDQLILLAASSALVRGDEEQFESPIHEVHFKVIDDATENPGAVASATLWKREDPFPDDYLDAGGVATPIVPGVTGLTIEAFDGDTWTSDWDSDSLGMPLAVRVIVHSDAPEGNGAAVHRLATSRALVALDRTPLPATIENATPPTGVIALTGGNGGTTTPTGGGTTPTGGGTGLPTGAGGGRGGRGQGGPGTGQGGGRPRQPGSQPPGDRPPGERPPGGPPNGTPPGGGGGQPPNPPAGGGGGPPPGGGGGGGSGGG